MHKGRGRREGKEKGETLREKEEKIVIIVTIQWFLLCAGFVS